MAKLGKTANAAPRPLPGAAPGDLTRENLDPGDHPCMACELRDFAFCGALEDHEISGLEAIVTQIELTPRKTIFFEGDPATHLFNVLAGTVKIYKLLADGRQQITGFLFPGDFLGLAFNDAYAYAAEAVGDVRLCRFPRTKLETMAEAHPRLETRLLTMASNELAAAQDQMLLLGRKRADEKVASFLLMLAAAAIRRGEDGEVVALPMTRTDIGDYLGLTIETVSRCFTRLKTGGAIVLLAGGRVRLADRAGLDAIAAGG